MPSRLWAWPAVSGDLDPPGPALYITWPAWESFCQVDLGEEIHPWLTPVYLEDPPNFLASLRTLLAIAREEGPSSLETPFFHPETSSIRATLLGASPTPLPPDHLILALGHLVRQEALAAQRLAREALNEKAGLMARLTDEPNVTPDLFPPSDQPDPSSKMAAAWLNLARPYLRAGDLLWPAYGVTSDFRPMTGLEPDETGLYPWPGSA
ncbi:MAG: hypothetical protein LBS60_14345 [Deltaproteobacteria bacterium]|jgi:hypothetical protein|nr:hypothetical protein [Deltaproteobacteria bacterium]